MIFLSSLRSKDFSANFFKKKLKSKYLFNKIKSFLEEIKLQKTNIPNAFYQKNQVYVGSMIAEPHTAGSANVCGNKHCPCKDNLLPNLEPGDAALVPAAAAAAAAAASMTAAISSPRSRTKDTSSERQEGEYLKNYSKIN